MPSRPTPTTYDDIVRRTVPDPDSSARPTRDQETRAYEGYRAMDAEEQQLYGRVFDALLANGFDIADVGVEVDGETVLLRGHVRSPLELDAIEAIVESVDGVTQVVNRLVVDVRSS